MDANQRLAESRAFIEAEKKHVSTVSILNYLSRKTEKSIFSTASLNRAFFEEIIEPNLSKTLEREKNRKQNRFEVRIDIGNEPSKKEYFSETKSYFDSRQRLLQNIELILNEFSSLSEPDLNINDYDSVRKKVLALAGDGKLAELGFLSRRLFRRYLPSIVGEIDYNGFCIGINADGSTYNTVYLFRVVEKEKFRETSRLALAQANLFAFLLRKTEILVEVYPFEEDRIIPFEKKADWAQAESELSELLLDFEKFRQNAMPIKTLFDFQ